MKEGIRNNKKISEIDADRKIREQTYKFDQFCPLCGSSMVIRTNRATREQFYGCSQYPKCNGSEANAFQSDNQTGFQNSDNSQPRGRPAEPSHHDHELPPLNDDLKLRWVQIAKLAEMKCGNTAQASIWLETPKIAFQRQKPIALLGTLPGCDLVERLLNDM